MTEHEQLQIPVTEAEIGDVLNTGFEDKTLTEAGKMIIAVLPLKEIP